VEILAVASTLQQQIHDISNKAFWMHDVLMFFACSVVVVVWSIVVV